VEDLLGADELFFTGTAVEVTAIREVDGRTIGDGKPGAVTRRIQQTFNEAVRGQRPQRPASTPAPQSISIRSRDRAPSATARRLFSPGTWR